jgi:hypothetical protein
LDHRRRVFSQHREPAESCEVDIDALGKPLVTNSVSYMAPGQLNPLYKNVVAPLMEGRDASARHVGTIADPWSQWNDRVVAIGGFETGSYSRSEFGADAATWRREIILVRRRGYLLARLPGAEGEGWLYEASASAATPDGVTGWKTAAAERGPQRDGTQAGVKVGKPRNEQTR